MRSTVLTQGFLFTSKCIACGNDRVQILIDGLSHSYAKKESVVVWPYRLLECTNCRLSFIDPLPDWNLLQTFYESDYGSYQPSEAEFVYKIQPIKYRIASFRYASTFSGSFISKAKTSVGILAEGITGKTVSYPLGLPLQLPLNASIMDVGYGAGDWLLMMSQRGYTNLFGYDIDVNIENISRLKARGIQVSGGQFEQNQYPTEAFDCIRLEHVFEHLSDPIGVLRKCYRMLKVGGFLVMSFPCKNSWSAQISLQNFPGLQLPKHIYHYTQHSVQLILQDIGFCPVKISAYSMTSCLMVTINNTLSQKGLNTIPPAVFMFAGPLYRLLGMVTRKGDYITVSAQKPRHSQDYGNAPTNPSNFLQQP